jgi:hypothetical protein
MDQESFIFKSILGVLFGRNRVSSHYGLMGFDRLRLAKGFLPIKGREFE